MEYELSAGTLAALREHLSKPTSEQLEPEHESNITSSKIIPNYASKSYWNERFEKEESYEWLLSYAQIRQHIQSYIVSFRSPRILVVGCGNSNFSLELYEDVQTADIVNIDFSDVVIERMKLVSALRAPNMKWVVMDMLNIDFAAECFDVVIDKATMDALFTEQTDVWSPNLELIEKCCKMCAGISKVLRPGGVFIQISFAQPHFRTKFLMNFWKFQSESNPLCSFNVMYLITHL